MLQKRDRIDIVEKSYDLELDDLEWTRSLLDGVGHHIDRGMGTFGYQTVQGGEARLETVVTAPHMSAKVAAAILALTKSMATESRRVHSVPSIFATATQNLALTLAEAATLPGVVANLHPVGVRDILAFNVLDPARGVVIAAPMPDLTRPTARDRRRWDRVAAHVAAAQRLRARLRSQPAFPEPDAVFDPKRGEVVHAEGEARNATARELLRSAALAVDRARGPMRREDEEQALGLWRALVAGRWSMVDRFEADGRRYVVAHRNAPEVADPRALTLRERQVLAFSSFGHSLKMIAYELGLSVSAVSAHRSGAMRKLGIRSIAELGRLRAAKAGDRSTAKHTWIE